MSKRVDPGSPVTAGERTSQLRIVATHCTGGTSVQARRFVNRGIPEARATAHSTSGTNTATGI